MHVVAYSADVTCVPAFLRADASVIQVQRSTYGDIKNVEYCRRSTCVDSHR